MKNLFYSFAFCLALSAQIALAQSKEAVTLKGQVVCSECWFEEKDRKESPYGNEADLKCAVRCAKTKVPQALAVWGETEATLYLLEKGKFKNAAKDWLEYIGKEVEITGTTRQAKDKKYLKVDALRVISSETENKSGDEIKVTDRQDAALNTPSPSPELALKDLSGVEQTLSSFRNQIVVLNFWATWCVPCREEMPLLVSMQKRYADRGVIFIAASADAEATQKNIPEFVRKMKLNFPVWTGATVEDMRGFGLGDALPATAIIDRDGQIVGRIIGVVKKDDLISRIDWLLGDRLSPAPAVLARNMEKHDDDHDHKDEDHSHGSVGIEGASSVPS